LTRTELTAYLDTCLAEVEAALASVLAQSRDCPDVLAEAMGYSLLAGGKRLRPILCLASADAVGGDRSLAMPAACAIELIHTYSLIHDDLPAMDDDTMRRGRPTLHVVAGDGMAILAGDGLLTHAFHLLASEPRTKDPSLIERKLDVIRIVSAAAGPLGMVGGQALDLACVRPDPQGRVSPPLDQNGLSIMHSKKTGALIRAAGAVGAIMGGGTAEQVDAIDRAAGEFGLAFQIVDDILDVEGTSAELGKTAGKDRAVGKPTYPQLYGLDASRRMARDGLSRAESILAQANLSDARLLGIGRWIVERSK
jgi:geranylgeranyl diphosphate synthase type II